MKDLTKGNEAKLVFYFTLPMLIGNVFQQLYNTVDSFIVGRFVGKEAMGAVTLSFPIMFLLIAFNIGITMGATILISQYYGARDLKKVKRTIDTTYIFIFIASIIVTIVGLVFSRPILELIRTPQDMMEQAKTYLDIIFIGMTFSFGYNTVSAILRGLGDSKTPLYFLIISTVINIILDLVFILVFNMGVAGAAWATIIAQAASFFFGIYHLNKNHDVLRFKIKGMVFDKDIFKESVKLGVPSGVQQTVFSFGMMAVQTMVNQFGTDTVAAFGAASRIDSFATMPMMNFGAAISTFVGQNVGANKLERVKKGYHSTLLMSNGLSVFVGIILVIFSKPLVAFFNTDSNVIQIGANYLVIVAPFYIVLSTMFVANSVMRGAGDAIFPMISSLVSLWFARIPLAFFLSKTMGPSGIWWSIPIGWVIGLIIVLIYYRSGRWKKKALVKGIVPIAMTEAEGKSFEAAVDIDTEIQDRKE